MRHLVLGLTLLLAYSALANAGQIKDLESCKDYVDKEIEYRYDLAELEIEDYCHKQILGGNPNNLFLFANPNALLNLMMESELAKSGNDCFSRSRNNITRRLERLRLIDYQHCHRLFKE